MINSIKLKLFLSYSIKPIIADELCYSNPRQYISKIFGVMYLTHGDILGIASPFVNMSI